MERSHTSTVRPRSRQSRDVAPICASRFESVASGVCPLRWLTVRHAAGAPRIPDVAVSDELFAPVGPGIELCYQTFGDPDDEPLLLVMGLGGPMTWWDPDLCRMLAARGLLRDPLRQPRHRPLEPGPGPGHPRDAGPGLRRPPGAPAVLAATTWPTTPSGCWTTSASTSAHLVGVSMGGMIVQTMAIEQPGRVRSLTSIMSTTGKRTVGWQHPSLMPAMISARRAGREAYVEASTAMWRLIGSPGYPADPRGDRASGRRDLRPRGLRQRRDAPDAGDPDPARPHAAACAALRVPALVVHGLADKMVHVSGGRATAAAIPGAELLLIDGMGHDLPPELFETFVEAIRRTADRASTPDG